MNELPLETPITVTRCQMHTHPSGQLDLVIEGQQATGSCQGIWAPHLTPAATSTELEALLVGQDWSVRSAGLALAGHQAGPWCEIALLNAAMGQPWTAAGPHPVPFYATDFSPSLRFGRFPGDFGGPLKVRPGSVSQVPAGLPIAVDFLGQADWPDVLACCSQLRGRLAWIEDPGPPSDWDHSQLPDAPLCFGETFTDTQALYRQTSALSAVPKLIVQLEPARLGFVATLDAIPRLNRPVLLHGHQPHVSALIATHFPQVVGVELHCNHLRDRTSIVPAETISSTLQLLRST